MNYENRFENKLLGKSLNYFALLLVVCSLLSVFQSEAWARWATPEDVASEIEFENSELFINADGTYTSTTETRVKILKESARETYATRRFVYNSMTSELVLLSAKTILDGKEFNVDRKSIEDKPLASSPTGFDQHNQILVAFPQVQVGAEIYYKVQTKVKRVPIPGFFSTSMLYGVDGFEKSGLVKVASEKPLFIQVNDPDTALKVEKKTGSGKYAHLIQIALVKPSLKIPTDESHVHLETKKLPWVDISSEQDWAAMGRPILEDYKKRLSEPLPPIFKKIAEIAKQEKSVYEQLNRVTSELATSINYMGDWRPVSGLYVPRPLDVIAETKFGDCKDFSATTAAVLRHIGMKAHIAWIKRGVGVSESPNRLPVMGEFNHAIVYAEKDGKAYWIDPTNFSSFAHGTFPDIADRKSLVLDPEHLELRRTPVPSSEDAGIHLSRTIQFEKSGLRRAIGDVKLKGASALPYTGMRLRASKQSIDYSIIKALGDENRVTEWKVGEYKLDSRIAQDVSFQFDFLEKNPDLKTSAGTAMLISAGSYLPLLLTKTTDRVSDLFIGTPVQVRRDDLLKGISKIGNRSLDCSIQSEWVDASRKVISKQGGLQVTDFLNIKKSLISSTDLQSEAYSKMRDSLDQCFNSVAIVYQRAR